MTYHLSGWKSYADSEGPKQPVHTRCHIKAFANHLYVSSSLSIMKTSLFKYTDFYIQKKLKFSDKNSDIFHISAEKHRLWYSLELPRRGSSNEYPQSMFSAELRKIMYTPVNSSFTLLKKTRKKKKKQKKKKTKKKKNVQVGKNYIDMFSWLSSIYLF